MSDAATALRAAAQAWLDTDPDPASRATLAGWLESGDDAVLREAFGARLSFGTAGLRGPLRPGPNGMNRALVRRVAAGLAAHLLATVPDATSRGVTLGYDGRHGSREFAEDTATVLADRGIPSQLFDDVVPTPRLAHAIVYTGACAGVMVTASHNPPGDNGYKVYWGDGAQIVPPHDTGISAAIDALGDFDPREIGDFEAHVRAGRIRTPSSEVDADYFARVQGLRVHEAGPVRVVYSAMHGVGTESVVRALREAGYDDIHPVPEQAEPDGDFPTVAFPNPEEPGALDLSLQLAGAVDADLIVANDPDADRLAVAVPDGEGGWRQLSGNQVGCLLADDLLTHGPQDEGRMVATTIVSSRLLQRLARAHGATYAETLTGFKWIAHAAIRHARDGGRFVMGYEEALGYSVGELVRDKDGVSAVLLFVDLVSRCKADGVSVLERLAELYRTHGLHVTDLRSVKLPGTEGKARIAAAMASLRATSPTSLGGQEVVRFVDVLEGTELDRTTGARTPCSLPRSNVLAWSLADGSQVLARPSGTEPKIKFYVEVREVLSADEPVSDGEVRARRRVGALLDEIVTASGLL